MSLPYLVNKKLVRQSPEGNYVVIETILNIRTIPQTVISRKIYPVQVYDYDPLTNHYKYVRKDYLSTKKVGDN